jgi:hypothetical protein
MNKPVENNDNVKYIRMITGEDIISEVIELSDNDNHSYMFINPMKIVYMMNNKPGPSMTISVMHWIFTRICDVQEFNINTEDVMTLAKPAAGLVEHYYECLEHFESMKNDNRDIEFDDILNDGEDHGLEALQKIMDEFKTNKRKLH